MLQSEAVMDGEDLPGVSLLSAHCCIMVKFDDNKEQVIPYFSSKMARKCQIWQLGAKQAPTAAVPFEIKGSF